MQSLQNVILKLDLEHIKSEFIKKYPKYVNISHCVSDSQKSILCESQVKNGDDFGMGSIYNIYF